MDFNYFDYMDEDKPEYNFTEEELNILDCLELATRASQYAYKATCAAMDMFKDVPDIANDSILNVLTDTLPLIVGILGVSVGNLNSLYLAYTTIDTKPEDEQEKFITAVEGNIISGNLKMSETLEEIREAFPADDGPERLDEREGKK